jgi:molybdate transport system permease protein
VTHESLTTLLLTLQIATVATLAMLLPGTLLAYALARHDFPGKTALSTVIIAPLVLPPTAVGFLLLRLLAFDGPLGERTLGFDLDLLLNWKGAVVASSIMSMPLLVRTARVAFEGVDPRLEAMARTLGHGRAATFLRYTLPLASRGLAGAILLAFTRAVGEFGATITIAGNIPGRTQTLASGIFSAEQTGDRAGASFYLAVALALGFAAVFVAEALAPRPTPRQP